MKNWNTILCVTTIAMTAAAGVFGLLYNRDHNILKALKAKNSNLNTSGLTEGQLKYFQKLKTS